MTQYLTIVTLLIGTFQSANAFAGRSISGGKFQNFYAVAASTDEMHGWLPGEPVMGLTKYHVKAGNELSDDKIHPAEYL